MLEKSASDITKTQLTITLVLILFLSIISATYAYYAIGGNNDNTITGDMATVNLTLTVTKVFPKAATENTGVFVPQLSDDSALSSALQGGCVDENSNVACQVYKIVVKNDGGSATEVVNGSISIYSNAAMTSDITATMPNLKWRRVKTVNTTTPSSSTLGTYTAYQAGAAARKFVSNVSLTTNKTATYYLILWINEINEDQPDQSTTDLVKTFYGKITFDAANGTGVTAAFQS